MKQSLFVLATLVVSIVSGCGGTESVEEQQFLAQSGSALSTCSTICPNGNPLSCEGSTCSSVDGQSVTCTTPAGTTTSYCGLVVDPNPGCSRLNTCSVVSGKSCSPIGSTRTCCQTATVSRSCTCDRTGKWSCFISDPGPIDPGPFDPHPVPENPF
ncbi:MAG: hypothetical protein ABW123_00215 [Cystobacter sp.]